MYFAIVNGKRSPATPGATGICELCLEPVYAKTGRIRAWHFAHANRSSDCDSWYEPETDWHRTWKSYFPEDWREVVVDRDGKRHRADVLTPSGVVLEFQHSIISLDDIEARDRFYGKSLRWIFDVREPYEAGRLAFYPMQKTDPRSPKGSDPEFYYKLSWKYPRKSIGLSTAWQQRYDRKFGIFFDVGDDYLYALQVWRIHDARAVGWCDRFDKRLYVFREWRGHVPQPLPWERQALQAAEATA